MGCVASRIDKEERVQICKERKRLMKQLVGFRREFAEAQLTYLIALKNTGVTLRQFTELDSLELEDTLFGHKLELPLSPPPPLPPPPPPPPTFSPDAQEEIIEIDEADNCMPPPPPVLSTSWDSWDPFGTSSQQCENESETDDQIEEEAWAETNTEFNEDQIEEEVVACSNVVDFHLEKGQTVEVVADNSSTMSFHTKGTTGMAMLAWSKKSLATIVKELDDYFLKASACGEGVGVLVDINAGDTLLCQNIEENKRKRSSSAKVFSALTWSWSSKTLHFTRDSVTFSSPSDPCRPGVHSVTLKKLYVEEERLYNEVKEEEITKMEHGRKSLLLQKQEDEDHDQTKTEKTRLNVESLQSDILCLQQSISRSCSSILNLITEELLPQLTALTSGLMNMWQTMYQCHQVQNHISQQVNHLVIQESVDPTTDYHRQAAAQLQREVTSWYNSFCKLMKFQREYVRSLCRWIELSDCLVDDQQHTDSSCAVHSICEKWQVAMDRLPDKAAAEAIKSFLSAINSIILQQNQELSLQKRSNKLERKFQRESDLLAEMEVKFERSFIVEGAQSVLSGKHPLSLKRAKIEALKKRADEEKAKYLNSVEGTHALTLNNLKTNLPNVFQALMGFSSAYAQAFEVINGCAKPTLDGSWSPMC